MTAGLICLIVALVCFLLAAIGAAVPYVALVPLGLFFLTLAFALGGSYRRPV